MTPENLNKLPPELQQTLKTYDANAPKVHFSPEQPFYPAEMVPDYSKIMGFGYANGVRLYGMESRTERVYGHFRMPFPPYPYQQTWVDALGDVPAAGMYFEIGIGKTATSTIAALYHKLEHGNRVIVLMPPILIRQWNDWLQKIGGIGSVLMYKGSPKERAAMSLDHDFILMSMDIFKRDFERIYNFFADKNCSLLVDEAVCIKNPTTQNHKCVWAFQNLDTSHIRKTAAKPKDVKKPAEKPAADLLSVRQKLLEKYRK